MSTSFFEVLYMSKELRSMVFVPEVAHKDNEGAESGVRSGVGSRTVPNSKKYTYSKSEGFNFKSKPLLPPTKAKKLQLEILQDSYLGYNNTQGTAYASIIDVMDDAFDLLNALSNYATICVASFKYRLGSNYINLEVNLIKRTAYIKELDFIVSDADFNTRSSVAPYFRELASNFNKWCNGHNFTPIAKDFDIDDY